MSKKATKHILMYYTDSDSIRCIDTKAMKHHWWPVNMAFMFPEGMRRAATNSGIGMTKKEVARARKEYKAAKRKVFA